MNNTELQNFYNSVYEKGEENYYSKFSAGKNISENDDVVFEVVDFKGKIVLDVGCGTGGLARRIGESGAKMVYGIDYAASAIEVAKSKNSLSNVDFKNISLNDWEGFVDVVISCGTLEHMDQPWDVLQQFADLIKPGGEVIISCPHFFNLRGFIWVGLQKLFDVPMSLTDVHSIAPSDIQKWIKDTGLELKTIKTFDVTIQQ
ncbi:MAG: methyltransferase domain-containing protein [Saprospiraceae bacterium]|jgi:2-polyprenyl-3-methyl-5-hydroxy-6-metoxy-1,4-benzoquinol methylase|nr:methyltransferase domain-containing protein [Saprospiraceae bacterium]